MPTLTLVMLNIHCGLMHVLSKERFPLIRYKLGIIMDTYVLGAYKRAVIQCVPNHPTHDAFAFTNFLTLFHMLEKLSYNSKLLVQKPEPLQSIYCCVHNYSMKNDMHQTPHIDTPLQAFQISAICYSWLTEMMKIMC